MIYIGLISQSRSLLVNFTLTKNINNDVMSIDNQCLLQAKQITCIREDRILFEHLDLLINSGDIVQVVGPNGAGKTSLLRILAGLSSPYYGGIYFRGKSINRHGEEYNAQILYLGHLAGIKGEMTVQENLLFNSTLHSANHEHFETVLTEIDLFGFEHTLANHLSAGQQRRIALAQLWLTNAPIWILDEPFTALDKNGVIKLEKLMVEHSKKGGCVILTTHQDLNLPACLVKKLSLNTSMF